MNEKNIIETTKQKLLEHYHNQVNILEVTTEDDTVWYKLHMKNGYFLPMHKHNLIEVDFDDKTVKMHTSIETLNNPYKS